MRRQRSKLAYKCRQIRLNWDAYLFLLPFALVFCLFTLAPVVTSLWYSFTYYNILEPAKFIGFQNYINLFLNDEVFLIALKNTFLIAAITGPVGYLASLLLAWFINELNPMLRSIMVTVFYAPSIYMMFVVILVQLWMSLGAGFLSFVAGFQTLDKSQYEAGYIDGISNRWQELWFITLPSMKPQLMFGAVMSITSSFAVGDITVQLCGNPSTDYAVHTVVNHLTDYGGVRFDMGYACAIASILFISMIVLNEVIQRLLSKVGR